MSGQILAPIVADKHHGSGPTNNFTVTSANSGGTNNASATATTSYAFAGNNVTSGGIAVCGIFDLSAPTFLSTFVTKTAGTATVGTVVLDKTSTTNVSIALYRVPITGTGTLTLTYNDGGTNYVVMGCTSATGVNASPVSTSNGTAVGGPGTLHSTGSISSTDIGAMFYVGSEQPNADFTRSWSDTIIYHIDTGASTGTLIFQYKVINAAGSNTMQDCTGALTALPGGNCLVGGDSELWDVIYQIYKST